MSLFYRVLRVHVKLRQPVKAFNDFMIKAIGYSPFIQDARKRHEDWERRFERMRGAS